MGIFTRTVGFTLMGPIGALGPTEASKRARKQLNEMKKQTKEIERQTQLLAAAAPATAPAIAPAIEPAKAAKPQAQRQTTQRAAPTLLSPFNMVTEHRFADHPFAPSERFSGVCSVCQKDPYWHPGWVLTPAPPASKAMSVSREGSPPPSRIDGFPPRMDVRPSPQPFIGAPPPKFEDEDDYYAP